MSLYKQGEIWWYEFTIAGKRFRSGTRTTDETVARKIEAEHRDSISRVGKKVSLTLHAIKAEEATSRRAKIWEGIETKKDLPKPSARQKERFGLTPMTLLQEAGAAFLQRQRDLCRRRTIESNEGHVRRLVEFFGNIPLAKFTIAHFEHYQSKFAPRWAYQKRKSPNSASSFRCHRRTFPILSTHRFKRKLIAE